MQYLVLLQTEHSNKLMGWSHGTNTKLGIIPGAGMFFAQKTLGEEQWIATTKGGDIRQASKMWKEMKQLSPNQ